MEGTLRTSVFLLSSILSFWCLFLPTSIESHKNSTPQLVSKHGGKITLGSSAMRRLASVSASDQSEAVSQLLLPGANLHGLNASMFSLPQSPNGEYRTYGIGTIRPAQFNGDVRNLPQVPSTPRIELDLKEPQTTKRPPAGEVKQESLPRNIPLAAMPSPIQNFAGMSMSDTCTGGPCGVGFPPDVNGDVGLNHFIEAVNSSYAIYNKTGTLLASFTENSLFSGGPTGTLCDTNSFGDPIVVYDQFADRWFLTNFAFVLVGANQVAPTFQCFAVSKTGDPVTGGWWLYAVQIDTGAAGQPPVGTLADYPKFGNWNDGCLYMGANGFDTSGISNGAVFASFSKNAMESGAALTPSNSSLGFVPNPGAPFTMIPSNISGAKGAFFLPPAGTPNYFVSQSQTLFAFEVRQFIPGASCGSGGTLGAVTNVSQAPYNVPGSHIVPQPPPATGSHKLDSLGDRIMQKVQYRRVAAVESLWVTHTFRIGPPTGPTGSQWAQLDVTGGILPTTPVQQQNYDPADTIFRWMSSIASDHVGNVALAYSTSNGASPNFPSIAYSGRLVTDPLNTLPQTETQLIAGLGSQTNVCGGGPCRRWGDYTSMSVDPADDCTFWIANMYYDTQANGDAGNWHTRIGSFKFPTCTAPTAADSSISGQIVTADGAPLAGVTVRVNGTQLRATITDGSGNYHFGNVETGGYYIVTPSLVNYSFSPSSRTFSLVGDQTDAVFTGAPDAVSSGNAIDTAEFFVRQHYLDFLGREPEQGGFDYWSNQINRCNGDANCINTRRIDVSAAFFAEPEFQQTGSFIFRLYQSGLGRQLRYGEFAADRQQLVVGNLDASKAAFARSFVERAEFVQRYQAHTTAASFVDALLQTVADSACVDLNSERDRLIATYNTGSSLSESRSLVLRELAENNSLIQALYNPSFVLMEYFGYLRRDPDQGGYDFWLNVLNNREPNNYRAMVCAFLTSTEYQRRFSSVITRSNAQCGR